MLDVNEFDRLQMAERVMTYYELPFDHVWEMSGNYMKTLLRRIYENWNVRFTHASQRAARKGLV